MNKTQAAAVAAHEAGYRVDKRGNLVDPDGKKTIPRKAFTYNGHSIAFKTFLAYCVHGEESFGRMYSIKPGAVPRPDTLVLRSGERPSGPTGFYQYQHVKRRPRKFVNTRTETRYHARCGQTGEHREYSQGKGRKPILRCVECSRKDARDVQSVKNIREGVMTFDRYIA